MTDRHRTLDRVWVVLLGLILLAAGLLLLDRELGLVGTYPDTIDLGPVPDVLTTTWWPWVLALAGVILGLLALRGLAWRVGRPGPATVRLGASGPTGRVEVDLRSVATRAAQRLEEHAPVLDVSGTTRRHGGRTVLELRGHVSEDADPQTLTTAAATCADEVEAAFPEDDVTVRVLLDAPRRARRERTDMVRLG